MGGDSFIRKRVEFAGEGVPLDRGIELFGIECLEPRAKPRKLVRGELFDGFLYIFGGGHIGDMADMSTS
jgi:hypothetical protein